MYESDYEVISEVIEAHLAEVDWDIYDANEDGMVDSVYILLRNYPAFGGPHFVSDYAFSAGNKTIQRIAFITGMGTGVGVEVLAHETCHLMGLPDIYQNVSINPAGSGANTIMDGAHDGDIPAIMKCMFDWIEPVLITGTTEVTLSSYSVEPQAAIVFPQGDASNANWFLLEYLTRDNNNLRAHNLETSGLRIWRITMDTRFIENTETFWDDGYFNSPYIYIETVRPVSEEWDYFFRSGDRFAFDTTPSSEYPQRLIAENGGKFMADMLPSGISIENITFGDDAAHFTVIIEATNRVVDME